MDTSSYVNGAEIHIGGGRPSEGACAADAGAAAAGPEIGPEM
jgi:hypothetical protein